MIKEYFENGEAAEVGRCLSDLDKSLVHTVAVRAIAIALDRKPGDRELVSQLLSDSYPSFFQKDDITKAFNVVLEDLEDLSIDVPDAVDQMARFLARAVADDCLAPKFLKIAGNEVRIVRPRDLLASPRLCPMVSLRYRLSPAQLAPVS